MKKYYTIIMLAIFFVVLSCNKEEVQKPTALVEGKLIAPNSETVVPQAQVIAYETTVEYGAYNNSFNAIDTTFSDGNGNYQFNIEKNETLKYRFKYSKEGHYTVVKTIQSDEIDLEERNIYDVAFHKKSKVSINLENVTPANSGDQITFNKKSGKTDCDQCCENGATDYPGENVDVSYICAANAGSFFVYTYTIANQNGFQFNRDSVFCTANDTAMININY